MPRIAAANVEHCRMCAVIELHADSDGFTAECTLDPTAGGRVATLRVDGTDVIVGPDPKLPVTGWGSYPMVPWAGRVRRGSFRIDGVEHHLPINFEQHAIHGTGFEQPWCGKVLDGLRASMHCELAWVFGGEARQQFTLDGRSLTCTLAVRAGRVPMPVTVGWHPWYVKPERVDLRFERMYVRDDDYIPTGQTIAPRRPPWDDCFTDPLSTPRLWIGDLAISITSDCDHWVVYDMPEHATCVEPQSGPPDAFNIGGATRLEPGQELRRTMTIRWARA